MGGLLPLTGSSWRGAPWPGAKGRPGAAPEDGCLAYSEASKQRQWGISVASSTVLGDPDSLVQSESCTGESGSGAAAGAGPWASTGGALGMVVLTRYTAAPRAHRPGGIDPRGSPRSLRRSLRPTQTTPRTVSTVPPPYRPRSQNEASFWERAHTAEPSQWLSEAVSRLCGIPQKGPAATCICTLYVLVR